MALRFNDVARNDAATGRTDDLTVLDVYTGPQPATAGTAASGTLLASITGITWGTAAAGSRSVSGTPNVEAVASGEAGWGRFRNAEDTKRMDGAVGAEFTLADTDIVDGGTVTLTSATITEPAS